MLTCVSDKSLLVVPGDVRGSDTVTLVVDENLDLAALHDTNARVGGSEINTDDCGIELANDCGAFEDARLSTYQAQ